MANIFPNNPIGAIPPELLKIFRLLKRLPDGYAVWMRLNATAAGPHFWVLRNDGRSLLMTVAGATTREVRLAAQSSLFGETALPGAQEEQASCQFLARLAAAGLPVVALPGVIAFPNVALADLRAGLPAQPPGMLRVGQDDLANERFLPWLEANLGVALNLAQRVLIRRVFTPEVIVPAALTVRAASDRGTDASLSEYVLSYNQEWVLKYDLDLPDEAEATSDDLHVQLVSGVAGSGKSLILLYRARLLRQFFPNKRILVMTHNRPLINDLERRYRQLSNGDQQVEWRTFHGWCHKYWPEGEPRRSLIGRKDRLELVRRVWHANLANTALSPEVLQDEIDWLKDRLITTREGYQTADRSGRGFRLTESLRGRVFDAIHAYQDALQERNLLDYGDVPRRVWRGILEGRSQLPQYDFILIDEAQFFAPIWFEILKQTLTPQHGQLFLVADPTQGFLKRRQSWLACGLNVRGRSHRLDQCYRTTRAILQFATRYYQLRMPDDSDAHMAANMQTADEGLLPQIVEVASEQDELTRVVNEIKVLVQAGVPLAHILVIHAEWQGAERLRERLQNEFGAAQAIDPRYRVIGTPLRVCSLDSATGLESPIVFLVGTHRMHEAEASVRLSEDERAERVRDTTRRLYMAMTRAGQRLVLTYVGTPPEAFRLP